MKLRLPILLVCALCSSATAQADTLTTQRQAFQTLWAAKPADNNTAPIPASLQGYPLTPWLEYRTLQANLSQASDTSLWEFAQRNPHSLMADELLSELAKRLASRQEWRTLLQIIPAEHSDTDTQCYRTLALANTGQQQAALATGKQTWLGIEKGFSEACRPVHDWLRRHNALSTEDYWTKIQTAIDKNQTTLASELATALPPDAQAAANLWVEMRKNPANTLATTLQQSDNAYLRAVIADGITRLAKKEPQSAEHFWQQARATFKFTPSEIGKVESTFGMYQALDHNPVAVQRLGAIPGEQRSTDGNIWLVRSAARAGAWQQVLDAAQRLPLDNPRDAAVWQYWQARALEQLGKTQQANSLYAQIAPQASFYGFLAADRLGQDYTGLQTPPLDRSQRVAGLQKVAAMQRAVEWFALGEREQGRKEWLRTLKQMDQEGMLAAAELAMRIGEPNLAIWTIARAKEWDEVHLRFPLLHTDLVQAAASKQGITPAWVFGVMRRESAFDPNAESSANALGLMQLIPPTARDMGRKLGINIRGKEDILAPTTNVQLGAAYLSDMLKKFGGNYAQATAAYNAGPARPLKWAPTTLMNADQWIESIPFSETRDYVQAVMTYTTIYDHKLNQGKGKRLSERLLPIAPNPTPNVADANTANATP